MGFWGKIKDFFTNDTVMTFIVPFGFIKTGVDMYDSSKEAARAQEEAEKQSRISNALNGDIASLPYIKGAKNTAATGQTQPYIIGRHLFTPYIMNGGGGSYKGWHKIGGNCGSDQYYGVVLEGGFSKQILECLNIGDVKAADFSGDSEPQDGIRSFKADSVFASPESFIEISQDGNGFESSDLNKKIVEVEANAQLKNADDDDYEDLFYTLDKNAMSCDVIIMFNGLYAVDGKGNKTEKKRTVVPSWSSDYLDLVAQGRAGEATWHEFTFAQADVRTSVSFKTAYYTASEVKADTRLSGDSVLTESQKEKIIRQYGSSWTKSLKESSGSWILTGGKDIRNSAGVSFEISYKYSRLTRGDGDEATAYYTPVITATQRTEKKEGWTIFSNDFSYNRQSQIRFCAHADFSFSDCFAESGEDADGNTLFTRKGPIAVRISTPDKKDDKARGDCYVQYVQNTCYSESASKASGSLEPEKVVADREARLSTLIGVYIKATEANEDKLDKISVVANGVAPYLDENGEWEKDASGALLKRPTSNAAAWTLEILTSDTHAPSKMALSEIDLDAFGKWHEHCDKNGLFVNKVLTGGAQKESLLASLAQAGRAVLYQDTDGRLSVAWDRAQDKPKMLLNAENMMSFSWKKDLSRQPDGVKMTFIESAGDVYDTDSLIRMYEQFSPDGEDQWADSENRSYDAEIKEIEGYGITSREQAYAYMDYVMRCARLRLKEASCQIGKEGAFLRPYDRVSVQHWAIGRGEGSTRVKSVIVNEHGGIIGVETYEPVMMGAGEFFYAQIQCTGGEGVSVAAMRAHAETARAKEIIFTRTFSGKISAGDIVSYGPSESAVTEDFIVQSVQPSGEGYALTLTEYDERIFKAGKIPDYESPLSLTGDVRRVNLPESVPEYTADELSAAVHSAASPYVHIVYCDNPETGENYSSSELRAYVGTYSDNDTEPAATFEEADGKPGMKWSKFVDIGAEKAAREAANVVTHGIHFTTMHRIKDDDSNLSLENIQRKIDEDYEGLASLVSMTESEFHWFVKNTDAERGTSVTTEINAKAGEIYTYVGNDGADGKAKSGIFQTADNIRLAVTEEAKTRADETKALGDSLDVQSARLDVQGGAVQAIVDGGGSEGYLGLSTELPVIIWGSKYDSIRAVLRTKLTAENDRTAAEKLLESVYVKVEDKDKTLATDGNGYYAIKSGASAEDCRSLFDYMKKAGLLASQFKVLADQMEFSVGKNGLISFNGQTIFSSARTSEDIDAAKKAAEKTAETDAADKQNAVAEMLGYAQSRDASAWENMVSAAADGKTVIKGGHINTTLINAKSVVVDGDGFFQKLKSYDTPESNFWDLSTGEFRIGNDISLEDSGTGLPKATGNGATYIHFDPKKSRFTLALTKFVLSSVASIIKGVFKVNSDNEEGIGSDFLTVNPDDTAFAGTPAKTVSVRGDISSYGKSAGDTGSKNHIVSRITDAELDAIFSIS